MKEQLQAAALFRGSGGSQGRNPAVGRLGDNGRPQTMEDPLLQHSKETYVLFGCSHCHGLYLVARGEATDLRVLLFHEVDLCQFEQKVRL